MFLTGCDDAKSTGSHIAEKQNRRLLQYHPSDDAKQRPETIRERLKASADVKSGKFKPESNPGRRK